MLFQHSMSIARQRIPIYNATSKCLITQIRAGYIFENLIMHNLAGIDWKEKKTLFRGLISTKLYKLVCFVPAFQEGVVTLFE